MKNLCLALVLLLVGLTGCATTGGAGKAGAKPTVFCQVRQPPDPLLLGSWETYFMRGRQSNYVKITLTKFGDKYGLYEDRVFGHGKRRFGWKDWIVNGKEIIGVPQKYRVRIFVQDHDVYFTIRGLDHPARMQRAK